MKNQKQNETTIEKTKKDGAKHVTHGTRAACTNMNVLTHMHVDVLNYGNGIVFNLCTSIRVNLSMH